MAEGLEAPCSGAAGERGVLWVSIRDIGWFRDSCTEQLVPKMEKRGGNSGALLLHAEVCQIQMHVGESLEKLLAS